MQRPQKEDIIEKAMEMIQHEDIAHRGFLKPVEVALKTPETQKGKDRYWANSLPKGLKLVVRDSHYSENYKLCDFQTLQENVSFTSIKEKKQDNLLSLIKQSGEIELAICVCMYSEDRKMLKSTLAGVEENIQNLVALQGICPDKIGVFVIMDGIEYVHESVIDYFEELERSSNIFLGDNVEPPLQMDELERINEEGDEAELKNINNFLFDPAELDQRNHLRFVKVRKDYLQSKRLLGTIDQLKKKNDVSIKELPTILKHQFYLEACQQRKLDRNQTEEQIRRLPKDQIIEQYATNPHKSKAIFHRALRSAEKECKDYIAMREEMTYVGCFRKRVPFSLENMIKSGSFKVDDEADLLNQEVERPHTYMNLFMCVKYRNAKKLSSHNWFFNGFCRELRPKYSVLLDVGLRPQGESLMQMYNYMRARPDKIGGVCGYMSLKIEKLDQDEEVKSDEVDCLTNLLSNFISIQRTQQVQYHFAHLMDKSFEAAFGFIHVLPGAFSAYNMKAIIQYGQEEPDELLESYFKSIGDKIKQRKIFQTKIGVGNAILRVSLPDFLSRCCIKVESESDEALLYEENMNLAEDRILCIGIHKKGENGYDMAFLPDAYAQVDPMKTLHSLMGQRKRWTNGSFIAFQKVKKEMAEFHERKQISEPLLEFQIFYLTMMNSMAYFSASFFLFTIHIAMQSFKEEFLEHFLKDVISGDALNAFVDIVDFIYIIFVLAIVFYSLHLKSDHQKFKPLVYAISTLLGLFMMVVVLVLLIDTIRGLTDNEAFLTKNQQVIQNIPEGFKLANIVRWALIGTLSVYFIPVLLYVVLFRRFRVLWQVLQGYFSFLFYIPTYLNILNIYSLCRIDDISWGTKGLDSSSPSNDHLVGSWKMIKMLHVIKFVIWNVLFSAALLSLGTDYKTRFYVSLGVLGLIASSFFIKAFVGMGYMVAYKFRTFSFSEKKPRLNGRSRVSEIISFYQKDIREQILKRLEDVGREYDRPGFMGSFIKAARSAGIIKESTLRKIQQQQKGSLKKDHPIPGPLVSAPPILAPQEPLQKKQISYLKPQSLQQGISKISAESGPNLELDQGLADSTLRQLNGL